MAGLNLTNKPKYTSTRLLERFAPIFYFNCEHFLSAYIVKNNEKSCGFLKKILDFQHLKKIEFCWMQIFEFLIIYFIPSLGTYAANFNVYIK